jgi:hypothetical protein
VVTCIFMHRRFEFFFTFSEDEDRAATIMSFPYRSSQSRLSYVCHCVVISNSSTPSTLVFRLFDHDRLGKMTILPLML